MTGRNSSDAAGWLADATLQASAAIARYHGKAVINGLLMEFPMSKCLRTLCLLTLLLPAGAAAAAAHGAAPVPAEDSLSDAERALIGHIDARAEQAVALLQRAVDINSGSLNLDGVRRVAGLFDTALRDIGLTTRWEDGAEWGRAGHLIGEWGDSASAAARVLLVGHLDTVFEPSNDFQRFERLPDGGARGPGVIDMKGGDVIIVEALAALQAVGALKDLQVTVILIGDEESSGRPLSRARRSLIEAAGNADVALGFEDGDGDPATAVIARRGYTGWRLEVDGTPAHSSVIFSEAVGYGAVFEMARIIDGFRRSLAGERYLTFNPALALAGSEVQSSGGPAGEAFGKDNVVPASAVVSGDLRTLSATQEASARQRMQQIVGDSLAGTRARLTFIEGYPPLAPSEGNRRLLALYDEASRDLGYGPVSAVDPASAGAADISFTAGHVPMALDGLGLMGHGGHTDDETADLATLGSQAKRAALLMYRLRNKP